MPEIYFTSDHHFGHKNILIYEKEARPFQTLEEMHEHLIDRWNSVVRDCDTIYHLGDFCFGRGYIKIAERLRGKKRLVLGNHDTYPSGDYLQYFDKLYGCKFWERCVLSHMPVHPNGLGSRWLLNLHGHLHSKIVMMPVFNKGTLQSISTVPDHNYFNVSVERHNLTPVSADVIRDYMKDIDL